MSQKKQIGFLIKYLSNRHYLAEVSVDGKKTIKFHYKLGYLEHYVSQIIRIGNGITLFTNEMTITEESFWNINHFEDIFRFVFRTFNKSFLLKITDGIETKKLSILNRVHELPVGNPVAYSDPIPETADEELMFCYRKKDSMKKVPKFERIFTYKIFLFGIPVRDRLTIKINKCPDSGQDIDTFQPGSLKD